MLATHVDLSNCTILAEWLEEQSRLPDGAKFAKSLRAVMAGFVATTGTITIETADEPEQTPWKCAICGKPVRLTNDLQPWHLDGPANHEAELSREDLKTLADGLRMSD